MSWRAVLVNEVVIYPLLSFFLISFFFLFHREKLFEIPVDFMLLNRIVKSVRIRLAFANSFIVIQPHFVLPTCNKLLLAPVVFDLVNDSRSSLVRNV